VTLPQRYWIWDVLILSLLATVLRFHGLDVLSFYYDEAMNALVARTYNETGHFVLPSGSPDPNGLLYKWMTAHLFEIFGESEWWARFPAALAGVLTTIGIYLWGGHWFGAWTGRWAALLYAIWPWSVTWGRIGRFYNLQQLFFLLMVVTFWKAMEKNRLGHTIHDPPRTAGRQRSPWEIAWDWLPFLFFTGLSFFSSLTTVLSLAFVPAYLLYRLFWSWNRGGRGDHEFQRTVWICSAGIGLVLLSGAFIAVFDPHVYRIGWEIQDRPKAPEFYLVYLRETFGLFFAVGTVAGAATLILYRGRPGWLVFAAAAAPLLMHSFFFPYYRPRFVYYTFPFLLMGLSVPLAWATQTLETYYRRCVIAFKEPTGHDVAACLLLAMAAWSILANVFLAPRSTSAMVAGSPYTMASEVADWKAMADWLGPYKDKAKLISTDPALCQYYFGRCDAIYPFLEEPAQENHRHTGSPILRDRQGFENFLSEDRDTLILGTRRKFESSAAGSEEAGALWRELLTANEEIWMGSLEVAIRVRKVTEPI
jgi:hypothetical protein